MAKVKTLSIEVDLRDKGAQAVIEKIGGSIKRLQVISGPTSQTIQKLRQQVTQLGQKGNNSISTIEGQIGALKGLRREADLNSKEFKELTADIDAYTKKLQKAQGQKKKGGLGARATTQIAGAVVSGGIFGGPEGAFGALGGAAFGGVQGAFAGAALGAQAGMLRKQLGEFASYAAQLEKLRISLRGITGTQEAYTQALRASTKVTKDLNIPQDVAIRGITRLTAAVKGAGGNITDTELAFRNINAAIIATGGDAQQAEGAITALVQIFSKGKVSAEEINQIAERLPGAFTKIEEASGRSQGQLAKDLQDGKVGLNDLMMFLRQLGVDYEELALKIAASDESAGARLGVVYDDLREQLGNALKPIGAELQNALNDFIKKNGPDLIDTAEAIGEALLFIVRNRGAIKTVAEIAAKLVLVNLAIKGLIALKGPARLMLQMLQVQLGTAGNRAKFANKKLLAVKSTLSSLALIGIVTVGVDIAITGFFKLQSTLKELRRLRGEVEEGAAARFAGEDREGGIQRRDTAASTLVAIEKEQAQRASGAGRLRAFGTSTLGVLAPVFGLESQAELAGRGRLLEARKRAAAQNLSLPIPAAVKKPELTKFSDPKDKGDKDGGKAAKALERRRNAAAELARKLQNAVAASRAQNEIEKLLAVQAAKRNDLQAAFAKLQKDGFDAQIDQLRIAAEEALSIAQSNQLRKRSNDLIEKAREPLKQVNQRLKDKIASDEEYRKLLAEGVNPELAKEFIEINKVAEASIRLLEIEITRLKAAGQITEELERQIEILEQGKKDIEGDAEDAKDKAKEAAKPPTIREGLIANIEDLKQELKDLVNPINAITNAANAIGDAFTDSFMSVITGSATTQEALASFFKNVGKFFLDMAAQIIQKMITLFILNQLVGLLPGGPGGNAAGGKAGGGGADAAGIVGRGSANPAGNVGRKFADGGVFAKSRIIPYAKGGIVKRPTLFPYADGGTGRFGLMGEAGPEAILPLQRGPEGKLGVQASGANNAQMLAAMNRYQRSVKASGAGAQGETAGFDGAGGAAGSAAIDVRFKVERINNVDYVTAAEFQEGMQQAAKQGAQRGEQQAIKRLQMSSSTRRRVGL